MSQVITREKLLNLVNSLIDSAEKGGGTQVIAPVVLNPSVSNTVSNTASSLDLQIQSSYFKTLEKSDTPVFDASVFPTGSIKKFFFPQHETICTYRHEGKELRVEDAGSMQSQQIIFGARPCDAALLPILDHIFSWDFQDKFYQDRRKNTTVVTLACKSADEHCFCTSVNLAPNTTAGADAVLLEIEHALFEVQCVTEKGTKLFAGKTEASEKAGKFAEPPKTRFDVDKITKYLTNNFDDPIFKTISLRCVGCGACTYLCPTCHCFDIIDEGGSMRGNRVKNWDSCQLPMFTYHASGHNPRGDQSSRQRNRIQHKFAIYPQKFGVVLCTGCGNCSRECSASLGIAPVLEALDCERSVAIDKPVQRQS